jgi:hypothetical protein
MPDLFGNSPGILKTWARISLLERELGGGLISVVVTNSLSVTHCLKIKMKSSLHCLF